MEKLPNPFQKTMVIDPVTILKALMALESHENFPQTLAWDSANQTQARLLELYARWRSEITGLHSLESMASGVAAELNNFLSSRGFDPMFEALGKDELGVAAVLDMLIEWLKPGELCDIQAPGLFAPFSGFEISGSGTGFDFYEMEGNQGPLIRLATKTGDWLWIAIPNEPLRDEASLAFSVMELMQRSRVPSHRYASVKIPMVDIRTEADISFMKGATTHDCDGIEWRISKAIQQFRFRINAQGARARVATGMVFEKCISLDEAYVVDGPFVAWMTQGKSVIPIAMAYIGTDCWKSSSDFESM